MKTILVDAWNTFIIEGGVNIEMQKLLDSFENTKIILTNANIDEQKDMKMVNLPYKLFSLNHNPNKTDGGYYEKMLEQLDLKIENVIYFEHNQNAIQKAQDIGINTYFYDKDKKDLFGLKQFLENNL